MLQINPKIKVETKGEYLACRRGKAYPRQPNSSVKGPPVNKTKKKIKGKNQYNPFASEVGIVESTKILATYAINIIIGNRKKESLL